MKKQIRLLKAMADETRLRVLLYLKDGEKNQTEIISHTKKSQSTISLHLRLLEIGGFIYARKKGRNIYFGIDNKTILAVLEALKL